MIIQKSIKLLQSLVFILLVMLMTSCKPKIFAFKAEQQNVSQGDTIKLHWKTRGKPMLWVHEKSAIDDPSNIKPDQKLMEFILTFKNSDIYQNEKVVVTPKETVETIFFSHSNINGDTLYISEMVNPQDLFAIQEIRNCMSRVIMIWHEGKVVVLDQLGDHSSVFNHSSIGGDWKIATLLSPTEIKNPSSRPRVLKFEMYKKHL